MQGASGFASAVRKVGLALAIMSLLPALGMADGGKEVWIKSLLRQLNAQRRYPVGATDEGGTAKVVFRIDRAGHLVSTALVESTGDPVLDQEALAMVKHAQPFAPPPPELTDSELTLLLPVVFAPRRTSDVIKLHAATL